MARTTASFPAAPAAASAHFEYGRSSAYGSVTADQSLGDGNENTAVSATLTGLAPATTYHVRLLASNADGAAQGADVAFTTLALPPVAPVVSKLTLTPGTFRVAPRKHPRRLGTKITYRDTAAATTAFSVEQRHAGVRKGNRCVAPPSSRTHRKKQRSCARYVRLRGSFSHLDRAGTNPAAVHGRARQDPTRARLVQAPGCSASRSTHREARAEAVSGALVVCN